VSVRVIFVVLACFSVTDVRAQAPVPLTLENAIARGFQTSYRLAELDARREAAQAAVDGREAAARPTPPLVRLGTLTGWPPKT